MTIRPVDLNGMIQRSDDVGLIKKQEDAKPLHDQQNIQIQVDKREDELAHVVLEAENTTELFNDSDAKDESKNKYTQNAAVKKKTKKQDKVVKKSFSGGFDIKI